MKKKLFVIIVLAILLMIFVIPKRKEESVKVKKEDYTTFNLKTGVEYLKEKSNNANISNYNDGIKGEMYTFSHGATEQTPAQTDYRYIGNNPNNYVYFNCEEENDTSTCEIWRIVGVFPVEEYEKGKFFEKIKIVRGEPLETMMSYKETDDDNYWEYSTVRSFFKNKYYNRIDSASSYGLFESARLLASNTRYYMGGLRMNSHLFGNADTLYSQERSTDFYDKNNQHRSTDFIDNIGLLYPSDNYYIYGKGVDDVCYESPYECINEHSERGWFYNIIKNYGSTWSITPGAVYEYLNYYNAFFHSDGSLIFSNPRTKKYIEPTIYLNSNVIIVGGDGSENSPYILSSYKNYITDLYKKITYNGVEYYVIDESDEDDYVTLLKAEPLSYKEVLEYSKKYNISVRKSDNYGMIQYYYADDCYYNSKDDKNLTGCTNNYNTSFLKKIVDGWVSNNVCSEALVERDGYSSRILSIDDLVLRLGYSSGFEVSFFGYKLTADVPDWVYNSNYAQWTMSSEYDNNNSLLFIQKDGSVILKYPDSYVSSFNTVRPLINIKKSMLNDTCVNQSDNNLKKCEKIAVLSGYHDYKVGDVVLYKDDYYYIIDESDSSKNYVTLLKEKPLTVDEIYQYGRDKNGNLFVNKNIINNNDPEELVINLGNNIGSILYYSSDTCSLTYNWASASYYISDYIKSGCKNSFESSDIKKLLDNWSKNFQNDLVKIDDYDVRLITLDELVNHFGYNIINMNTETICDETDMTPEWINNYSYWTMTPANDDSSMIIYVDGNYIRKESMSLSGVRPVINVDKCAIEGGCLYDEEYVCTDDVNNIDGVDDKSLIGKVIVTVANTLKHLPQIILFISVIFIIIGLSIFGYNYYKSRKERK